MTSTNPSSILNRARTALIAAAALALAGCSSISGLIDAHDEFGCPMKAGVSCRTLSETHGIVEREIRSGESPRLEVRPGAKASGRANAPSAAARPASRDERAPIGYAEPVRDPMRASESVLVLNILPWVDAEGDLHGEERVWVRVAEPKWRIESLRRRALSGAAR